MAHSIPSHSRGVRSRGSLIPLLTGAFPYAAALPYLLIGGSPPTAVVSVAYRHSCRHKSCSLACVARTCAWECRRCTRCLGMEMKKKTHPIIATAKAAFWSLQAVLKLGKMVTPPSPPTTSLSKLVYPFP